MFKGCRVGALRSLMLLKPRTGHEQHYQQVSILIRPFRVGFTAAAADVVIALHAQIREKVSRHTHADVDLEFSSSKVLFVMPQSPERTQFLSQHKVQLTLEEDSQLLVLAVHKKG